MTVNKPTHRFIKHRTASILPLALGAAALGFSALSALAQGPGPGGPPPGHRPPPPPPPLFEALDTDHDGVLSADEIKNASTSLLTLDKNKDNQLTNDELRPPRPEGGKVGPGGDGDQRPPPPPRPHRDADDQAGGPRGDDAGGPPRPPRDHRGPHPRPPVFAALDANHDGALSPEEIANASAALKTLDKNNDGQLTEDEMRPAAPPPHPQD